MDTLRSAARAAENKPAYDVFHFMCIVVGITKRGLTKMRMPSASF